MLVNCGLYRNVQSNSFRIYRNGLLSVESPFEVLEVSLGFVRNHAYVDVVDSGFSMGDVEVVSLHHDGFIEVCNVDAVTIINNNLSRIWFTIDAWNTANANGTVNIFGTVSRGHTTNHTAIGAPHGSHFDYGFPFYSTYNVNTSNTGALRQGLNALTGIPGSVENIQTAMCWVLLVSERILVHAGNTATTPWQVNPTATMNSTMMVTALPETSFKSVPWGGELLTGTPIVFTSVGAIEQFVRGVSTASFQMTGNLPTTSSTVIARSDGVINTTNTSNVNPVVQSLSQTISEGDIVGVLSIPTILANANSSNTFVNVELTYDTTATTPLLNAYPYEHQEIVTPAGDSLHIIPQNVSDVGNPQVDGTYNVTLRFIGGMNPHVTIQEGSFGEVAVVIQFDTQSFSLNGISSSMSNIIANGGRRIAQSKRSFVSRAGGLLSGLAVGLTVAGAKITLGTGGVGAPVGLAAVALGGVAGLTSHIVGGINEQLAIGEEIQAQGEQISASPSITSTSPSTTNLRMFTCYNKGISGVDKTRLQSIVDEFGDPVNGHTDIRGGSLGLQSLDIRPNQYIQFSGITRFENVLLRLQGEITAMFLNGVQFID